MSVGKSQPHDSARQHVTGRATYTDDQYEPSNQLICWPVFSEHAHAKLKDIDITAALALPGVITILQAHDIPGENDSGPIIHDEILLPTDTISYWGQAIAWIVAEDELSAQQAAKHVNISCEPLQAILSLEEAINAQSFHGDKQTMRKGDPIAALSTAEHRFQGELFLGGQDHFYLETQTTWVVPNQDGSFLVHSSTQHPTETQTIVARVLGIPRKQVVVTCLRMGGGFGGKETQANPYAAVAALAAHKTQRPVKLRLKRSQDMINSGKRHPFLGRYQVGFDEKGTLLGVDVDLYSDGGWSTDLSHAVMQRAMFHVDNCYYIPNIEVRGRVCKTNKTSQTAFRGFGGPQGMVIIEEIMDQIARYLQLEPERVRELNFYHGQGKTATTHYHQEIKDVRIQRIWSELKQRANFTSRKKAITTYNQTSSYHKRGIAISPVKFGISFTTTFLNQAGAFVLIYADGSVQLNHGGTEMGQGLHIKMLQVAASTLGISLERIRIMPTSTDKVPNTSATAASSGSDLNGQAVKQACLHLKHRLSKVAANMLDVTADSLQFKDDRIHSTETKLSLSFNELVTQAYLSQVSLASTGFYRTPSIYFDKHKGQGTPFYYFAYGAAVSEVEVDGLTGEFSLKRVDIVHDVGDSLNPLIDLGQIEGGFVQGLGWLTTEELVWDDSGRLRTTAPSTYKIPTIHDIPESFNIHLLEQAKQEGVIYGSKAVGEPPFMLAISVREAIRAAVASFGHKPKSVSLASPATPEAILFAITALNKD